MVVRPPTPSLEKNNMLKHALAILAVTAVALAGAVIAPAPAQAAVNVYTTPGRHTVDGRQWNTECAEYDAKITRCRAEIKSNGKWVFNNLTYLAADRDDWYDNPLARAGSFSSEDRDWRTSCNDEWTGVSACRSFIKTKGKWIFNNLVYFTPGTVNYPRFTFNQRTGKLTAAATPSTRYWILDEVPLFMAPTGDEMDGVIATGAATIVTKRAQDERSEVFHNGVFRWVPTYALIQEGVEPPVAPDLDGGPSLNRGYSSGLDKVNPNTKKVVRHVWDNWSQIKTMYGWSRRATPDHPAGRAVDVMIPSYKKNNKLGWEMARYYRKHASEFGISYVIFDQQIWSVARTTEGWRKMADRGGDTANHIDHLHINTHDA